MLNVKDSYCQGMLSKSLVMKKVFCVNLRAVKFNLTDKEH